MQTIEQQQLGSSIFNKTVILVLEMHKPGMRRKVSTSQITTDADPTMVNVSKQLVDSKEFKEIEQFDSSIRRWVYAYAIPCNFRNGMCLVATEAVLKIDERLRNDAETRKELVGKFLAAYPNLVDEAKQKLGTLFNQFDYPTSEKLERSFGMNWQIISFEIPGKLSSLSDELFRREQQKAMAKWNDAAQEGIQGLRLGFLELVEHMKDRLELNEDGTAKQFKNSLVGNLKEFFDTFDFRNVCNDAELASQVAKARSLLDGVNPDTLRKEEALRSAIHGGMVAIAEKLDTMVENRPKRKIRINEPVPVS